MGFSLLSPIGTTENFFRPLRDSIFTSLLNPALKRWAIFKLVPPVRKIKARQNERRRRAMFIEQWPFQSGAFRHRRQTINRTRLRHWNHRAGDLHPDFGRADPSQNGRRLRKRSLGGWQRASDAARRPRGGANFTRLSAIRLMLRTEANR